MQHWIRNSFLGWLAALSDKFELNVEIAVNTTARIFVAANSNQTITMTGIMVKTIYNGKAIIKIGPGKYDFATNK